MSTRRRLIATASSFALAPAILRAQGQWPDRPVRFIVPFTPGGTTDILGRLVAEGLARIFGQQFLVDNRPGAGANIGAAELARAAPDGYTIGMITVGTHAINPALYAKMPFDHLRDFTPISLVATLPNLLSVHPSVPADSVPALIALAKRDPGKYTFGSAGAGTSLHLAGELFNQMAGVQLLHVPYRGGGPLMTDLLAGTVHMSFSNMPSILPHVRSGKVRGLAVTSLTRNKETPDLPAIAETLPGYEATSWHGVAAPAGLSAALLERLNAAIRQALAMPDIATKIDQAGATAAPGSPAEFRRFIVEETARWAPVVRASGARVE
ncbi:MAG: tripartite tricarboxylate transporter substrate binding protein [Alphaproteobacteria bacterium]|nr:tripartite tricarboxylate transporter substrate binding protein [Alphaproteobacteria bacterium]